MTIEYVTDQSFDERVLNSALPVLVLFWRIDIEPVGSALSKIANSYGTVVRVAKFETTGQRTPTEYVRGVPEVVLFKERAASPHLPRNHAVGAKIEDLTVDGIGGFLKEHEIVVTPPL